MNTQQALENDTISLIPLKASDFEQLFQVASDPLIWEQHPNKDRYKREVFQTYFEGALASKGAYLIVDKKTSTAIGSTRFYDLDMNKNEVLIGYTFIARAYWGTSTNSEIKKLMLAYAFQYVDSVKFHIGDKNIRSQKAIEKLGAQKNREIEVEYYGEDSKLNYEYLIQSQI